MHSHNIADTCIRAQDRKEPIQIIRSGRIITLPPVEAPATRSKRLQAKGVSKLPNVGELATKSDKVR